MTRTNGALRGVLVLLIVVIAAPLFAQSRTVKVCVFAEERKHGYLDVGSKGRAESVKDIRKLLKDKHRFKLVKKAEDANIVLEVTRRDIVLTFPSVRAVLRLEPGPSGQEFVGNTKQGDWASAAADLADKVAKWVKENDALIPGK